jgi:hypothetical protein
MVLGLPFVCCCRVVLPCCLILIRLTGVVRTASSLLTIKLLLGWQMAWEVGLRLVLTLAHMRGC